MIFLVVAAAVAFTCVNPSHYDGDAIHCAGMGARSMRLYGIDAPEMPGSCRPGRACTPGDPYAARDHLASLTEGRNVTCEEITIDRYGRAVVRCAANGEDISCAMVRDGYAVKRYGRLLCGFDSISRDRDSGVHTQTQTPLSGIVIFYLFGINLITYLAFWDDKRLAIGKRYRWSERKLLTLALIGGSPAGVLALYRLRHKIHKQPFAAILLVILGLHVGVMAGLFWP